VLIALGTWQIERKAWKEALIARLAERLAAPPMPLPPPATWPGLDRSHKEYRRVTFSAEFDNAAEALVYAAASAFRPDASGPGFWVLTPARLSDGSLVVVNRGFVPNERRDPNSRPEGQIAGKIQITGVMRWPDARNWFTPNGEPAHNLWFVPDPAVIAASKGWGRPAPFYVEQEEPRPPGGLPQPGKIVIALPNNHLQYALTWYGLALVLAASFIAWVRASFGSAGKASPACKRAPGERL
jgi:surfeit locus 1 family protein